MHCRTVRRRRAARWGAERLARIVVSGYYGFGNAGDEIILRVLLRALDGHDVVVLSADPAATRRDHCVAAAGRTRPATVLRLLAACDLLVSGGGGLLQDATGPGSVPYYLGVIAAARSLRKPFMIYAQGIGPLRAAWARAGLRLLRGAAAVTVRDTESAEYLQRAGVRQVEVTADAVLSLPRPSPLGGVPPELRAAGVLPGETVLAIAPRPHSDTQLAVELAVAAEALAERLPARVVLVPMQYSEDTAACAAVAAAMRRPPVVLSRRIEAPRYAEVFAGFHLVLGMRLHALILAALARIPAIGLSYDPKIQAFLRGLGRGDCELGLDARAAEIVSRVEAVFPQTPAAASDLDAVVRRLQVAARRNDERLRELLPAPRGGAPQGRQDARRI